jgi:RsiW-degrading membrane proteinase PrsW (M82 family)
MSLQSPEAVGPVSAAAAHQRNFSRTLKVTAVLVLMLLALVTLLVIGVDVGPVALATGLVLAAVPAPLYVLVALRVDRFEPEPVRALLWTFFWGASAATFIALLLNTAGQAIVGHNFGSHVGEIYGGSVSAPIVEESAKGAVLFAIYRWRRAELDGILDGIVYAAMVGLGFAMTENILYYGHAAAKGGVPLAATFFFRGVLSPFTHPIFTSMTGIGLGIAAQSTRRSVRLLAPAAGLLAAMALHSLWNTSAGVGGGAAFFGVYFLIMVPVFCALVVVVVMTLRREGRVIAEQLAPEVAGGVLSAGDVMALAALHERRRMRKAAKRDGPGAKAACRFFQETATDLAFLRSRVARGLPVASGSPNADEIAYRARLRELRPQVGAGALGVSHAAELRVARVAQLTAARALPAYGQHPHAAWYADPWSAARWRWWDGAAWTHHTAD